MEMKITLSGGAGVDAEFEGFVIKTDQPLDHGGRNSAPSPFDHFLASIGTCAGYYVLSFLRQRGLPSAGVGLTLKTVQDEQRQRLAAIRLELRLPPGFPAKYRKAIVHAADLCSVKRQIIDPPRFETTVEVAEPAIA